MTTSSAHNHIRIASLLMLVTGVLSLVPALFVLLTGIGLAGSSLFSGNALELLMAGGIVGIIALFLVLLALPAVVAGFGLLARKRWARPLALFISIFYLAGFPLGTLFAFYMIWVLAINEETVATYKQGDVAPVREYA
jgi:hypothetical protein